MLAGSLQGSYCRSGLGFLEGLSYMQLTNAQSHWLCQLLNSANKPAVFCRHGRCPMYGVPEQMSNFNGIGSWRARLAWDLRENS